MSKYFKPYSFTLAKKQITMQELIDWINSIIHPEDTIGNKTKP